MKVRDSIGTTELSHNKSVWSHAVGPGDLALKKLGQEYEIPLSILRSALDEEEKPKVYPVDHSMLVVVKVPKLIKDTYETSSAAFFLTKKGMLSVCKEETEGISNLLKNKSLVEDYLKRGPPYLLYRALEAINDHYFKIMDTLDEDLDKIEHQIFNNNKTSMKQLYKVKKSLIYFHKGLANNRDVYSSLEKAQNLSTTEAKLFGALKDEALQMNDTIALYREIITSTQEIYLTNISNNLNVIMKRLTAGASLVMIPTFITGLYGMNFQHLPEIYWTYGYAFAWGVIIMSVLILWYYFKKNDYL